MTGSERQGEDRGEGQRPEDPTVHDLAAAYALDAVDDVERRRFEAHLAGCEVCRQTVAELTEASVELSEDLQQQPPPALRERVLAAVADEPEASRSRPARTGAPARRGRWWLAAAAAAAVTAGAVVATQWGQDDGPGSTVAVQEVLEAEDAQWSTETVDGSTVQVVRSQELDRAVLVAEEMPELPPGRDYQLWFVHEDGSAVSAGLVPRPGEGRVEVLLEGAPGAAAAVGVTVEPEGGSEQPTSEPVVAVPLRG